MRKNNQIKRQKKKWEEDINHEEVDADVFKQLSAPAQKEAEAEEKEEQEQSNKPVKQKKTKEFAWMSDDDEPVLPAAAPAQQSQKSPEAELDKNKHEEQDLFVTGIPPKAKQDDLRSYLSKFGTIDQIYIPMNEGTEIHKGKAFVRMIIREKQQIAERQHRLKGHPIQIKIGGASNADNEQPCRSRSRSRSR